MNREEAIDLLKQQDKYEDKMKDDIEKNKNIKITYNETLIILKTFPGKPAALKKKYKIKETEWKEKKQSKY